MSTAYKEKIRAAYYDKQPDGTWELKRGVAIPTNVISYMERADIKLEDFKVTDEQRREREKQKRARFIEKHGLIEIILDAEKVELAKKMAGIRSHNKQWRGKGRRQRFIDDLTGSLGELAVEQWFSERHPFEEAKGVNTGYLPYGDDGYDMQWGKYKIEVKSTQRLYNQDLQLWNPGYEGSHLSVLCKVWRVRKDGTCAVDLVGWVSNKQYRERNRKNDFGHRTVRMRDLNKMRELFNDA